MTNVTSLVPHKVSSSINQESSHWQGDRIVEILHLFLLLESIYNTLSIIKGSTVKRVGEGTQAW